jgi:hypothetical protein
MATTRNTVEEIAWTTQYEAGRSSLHPEIIAPSKAHLWADGAGKTLCGIRIPDEGDRFWGMDMAGRISKVSRGIEIDEIDNCKCEECYWMYSRDTDGVN